MKNANIDLFELVSGRFKIKAWGNADDEGYDPGTNYRVITVPGQPHLGFEKAADAIAFGESCFASKADLEAWARTAGNGSHLGDDDRHGAIIQNIGLGPAEAGKPTGLGSPSRDRNIKVFRRVAEQLSDLEMTIARRKRSSAKAGEAEDATVARQALVHLGRARQELERYTSRHAGQGTR